jgi:hypothetical protein
MFSEDFRSSSLLEDAIVNTLSKSYHSVVVMQRSQLWLLRCGVKVFLIRFLGNNAGSNIPAFRRTSQYIKIKEGKFTAVFK